MRFIGKMNYLICILKMNVMINEYLKIARKIILDNYFDWNEYYKEN